MVPDAPDLPEIRSLSLLLLLAPDAELEAVDSKQVEKLNAHVDRADQHQQPDHDQGGLLELVGERSRDVHHHDQ
jgi:hypothetical protein